MNNIGNLAFKYKSLQTQIKALEFKAADLKSEMIAILDAANADKMQANGFEVRHQVVETKKLDTAKLKAVGLYDQYLKTSSHLRFQVT